MKETEKESKETEWDDPIEKESESHYVIIMGKIMGFIKKNF